MCLSATASFSAGAVLLGLGALTLKSARRPRELLYAAIPLLLGAPARVPHLHSASAPDLELPREGVAPISHQTAPGCSIRSGLSMHRGPRRASRHRGRSKQSAGTAATLLGMETIGTKRGASPRCVEGRNSAAGLASQRSGGVARWILHGGYSVDIVPFIWSWMSSTARKRLASRRAGQAIDA